MVDLVLQFLQVPDGITVCGSLLSLLATVLSTLSHTSQEQSFDPPMSDNIRLAHVLHYCEQIDDAFLHPATWCVLAC